MTRYLPRLLAATLCSAALMAGAARSETLADALISAYKNSNLLEQNRAVLRAADEDVADAVSALRPVLQWVANVQQYDTRQRGAARDASIGLQGQMTLLDFGRNRLGVEIAKETVLATREALIGVEQDVLLAAVQAFFDVRSASENVANNQNSVRVVSEFLRATQDQFDVGEVTRTDVAQAQARLAASRAGLAAAEGTLVVARESYRAATGHYPGPLANAPRPPALPKSPDEASATALRNHPGILQAQHMAKVADLGISAAAAARMPELTGSVGITHYDGTGDDAAAEIELSQTIYAGGKLSAAHRKALAQRDQARAALLQASVGVSQGVGNAFAAIEIARAQISATDRQIEAAQIAYDGVREEAKLGARTTLDVLDAEQELLDARAARITAVADLQVANYSLLSAMGLLTAEHLNLGIPTYDAEAYYNAVKKAPSTSLQGKSLDRVLQAIGKN
ncbi:MAG: TolC family outer membrane protein [Rhodobacteraceae bacterium]|nr:TolC family outer membrane protein [Paracoccaceae bacterium]